MEVIKKLIDPITQESEQIILINEMINEYDLPFTTNNLYDAYKIIRDQIRKLKSVYSINTENDISSVIFILNETLIKNREMHNSLIRSLIDTSNSKSLKVAELLCLCQNGIEHHTEIANISDHPCIGNISVFKKLLRYGVYDFEKYCGHESFKKHMHDYVAKLYSGCNMKKAI
jgi:hypothetical protein